MYFSSTISLRLYLRPSAALYMLTSWPCGSRLLWYLLLLPLVFSQLFSWAKGVLFHQKFLMHLCSQYPLRKFCSLVTLAVSSRLCCNRHGLLLNFYFSINDRIENFLCCTCDHTSQDTSHILFCPIKGLFAPLRFWRFLFYAPPLVQILISCPAFGALWSSL